MSRRKDILSQDVPAIPLNFLLNLTLPELDALEGLFRELLALAKHLKRSKKKQTRREIATLFSRTFLQVHLSYGTSVTVSHQWWKNFLRRLEEPPKPKPDQFSLMYGVAVKAKRSPRHRNALQKILRDGE
jgi:hypothetical protein